jgi:hypothetical protein
MINSVIAIFLIAVNTSYGQSEKSIFDPGKDKKPPIEMSACNECDKKVKKLSQTIDCYKCCIGELPENSCEKFNNHSKKKNCGCN